MPSPRDVPTLGHRERREVECERLLLGDWGGRGRQTNGAAKGSNGEPE
jgi:hypothetical protein